LKKDNQTPNCRLGTVGGQAVIEGVMMKNKDRYAVSVRMPDGSIKTSNHTFTSIRKKYKFLNIPILRGFVNFIETMKLSYTTLSFSAEALGLEEEEEESWLSKKLGDNLINIVMTVGMILGVVLSFGLFFFLPSLFTKLIDSAFPGGLGWFRNLIEGLIKITIFIGYLAAVSLMPDIKRTFEYHGAEHKSIYCYESGEELTPENVMKHSRFHPRCGTSFMFVMLAISVLIFSLPFVTWENMFLRLITKILLLPVVVGVGFEFLMYAGKHNNLLIRILSAPGLWMQNLTTREPDISQVEVAIVSLKASMPEEFPTEAETSSDTVSNDIDTNEQNIGNNDYQ